MDIEKMREKLAIIKAQSKVLEDAIAKAEEETKDKIGFGDDPIFLLSVEEYERLKNAIPCMPDLWWLRSSYDGSSDDVHDVDNDGYADGGDDIGSEGIGVRPVINLNKVYYGHSSYFTDFDGVKKVSALGATWVRLTADYYIAENPIAFRRFDSESNDYESSEIRQFLLSWFETRNA